MLVLVHTARPDLFINWWPHNGDPVPFSAARCLVSYMVIFVDTEKPLFPWRVIHSIISISNCGHFAACPQKRCFILSIFCSWSSCFLHSRIIFSVGGGPKCLSAALFPCSLVYFTTSSLKGILPIWNPFLLWHLSTITVDSAGDYGMLPNLSITKYSNDRTISTVSFIVMGAL